MNEYQLMLNELEENKDIQWSKFYKFDKILRLEHWVVDGADKNKWRTTLEKRNGDLAQRDGCLLQENESNPLKNDYCGLYMLRAPNNNIDDDDGFCDYIGMSSAMVPAPYQRGIYGRLASHVLKMQFLPERGKLKNYYSQLMPGRSLAHYRSKFSMMEFDDYEHLRNSFKKDGEYVFGDSSTEKFKNFYMANKQFLKTYEHLRNFFNEKIKIRFLNVPYCSSLLETQMEKEIGKTGNGASLKHKKTWSKVLDADQIEQLSNIRNSRIVYDKIIKEAEDYAIKTYGNFYYKDETRKPYLNYQPTKLGAQKSWMIRNFLKGLK